MVFYNTDKKIYFTVQSTSKVDVLRVRLVDLMCKLQQDKQLQSLDVKTIAEVKKIYHVSNLGENQIRAAVKGMAAASDKIAYYINGVKQ